MQNNTQPQNDEIDLFELASILWSNKAKIIIMVFVFAVVAAIYAFVAKEVWTSKAQVVTPKPIQLGTYLEAERQYYRFAGGEFDSQATLNFVFKLFIRNINASDNRLSFFKDSEYYKKLAEEKGELPAKELLLEEMALQDTQIKETQKGDSSSFDISFSAQTAEDAQSNLQKFINTANEITQNDLFENLFERVKSRIATLEQSANTIKSTAEQQHKDQIQLLEQALNTAKELGITEQVEQAAPSANVTVDLDNKNSLTTNNALVLMGSKFLQAQLNTLTNSPVIYPATYYQTLINIEGLKPILNITPKGETFDYTRTPSIPIKKDSPKRTLIILAGCILGGIVGCIIILLHYALRVRRRIKC